MSIYTNNINWSLLSVCKKSCKIKKLQKKKDDAQIQIELLEKENKSLEKENKSLEKENKLLEKENKSLEKENELLKKENELLKKENELLKKVEFYDRQIIDVVYRLHVCVCKKKLNGIGSDVYYLSQFLEVSYDTLLRSIIECSGRGLLLCKTNWSMQMYKYHLLCYLQI